jgi:hypothetical protein
VENNGETRTFKVGEDITLPPNVGGSRSFTSGQIEFLGYGLEAPGAGYSDYDGTDVKGKVAVFTGCDRHHRSALSLRRAAAGGTG